MASSQLFTAGVQHDMRIHTHMCSSSPSAVLQAIVDMDAGVVSLKATWTNTAIVGGLAHAGYPNGSNPAWNLETRATGGSGHFEATGS